MEDFVRIFQTSTGDVYHISLSEGHSVLSAEAIDALKDVSIVGIELRRLAGRNATGQEVLDVKMYNKHIFLGNKSGLYEVMFDEIFGMNIPAMHKRFDAKVVHVDAKFETVVISAGREGLFTGYVPENEVSNVTEREIMKSSFRSAWSIYNIMNYEQPNEFTCLVNSVEKIPMGERKRKRFESQESYKILEVGKEQLPMDQLMKSVKERGKEKMNQVSYIFNSHQYGYFLKKTGKLLRMNIRSKQDDDFYYSSVIQEYPIEKTVKGEKPISASILPNGCVWDRRNYAEKK